MSVSLLKRPTDTTTVTLPDVPHLDTALDGSIDDVIAQAALAQAIKKVSGRRGDLRQSHTARAWTRGGSVD